MYTTPPFANKRASGTPPNPGGEYFVLLQFFKEEMANL